MTTTETHTQSIVIVNQFDVHAATCSDLQKIGNADTCTLRDMSTKLEAVEEFFGDILDENGTSADAYLGEFHWLPCVKLPVR